ncbi:hypothetical protein NFI96_007431 [Prochilodus magdalenae]|nr:hypothetical protein NFI96_007431 [Prochilodus magdalenae]
MVTHGGHHCSPSTIVALGTVIGFSHTCSVVVLWGSCPLKNRVIQYTEKQMDYSLDLYTYRVSCMVSGADKMDTHEVRSTDAVFLQIPILKTSTDSQDPHRTTTEQSFSSGHRTLPHRTLPTGRCPTGRAPQDAAPQDAAPQDPALQDAAHRTLPHRKSPHRMLLHRTLPHRTLPTGPYPAGRCPTGSHPTGCCSTGHCPTGRCPQDPTPQDTAPQDAAHRTLPRRTLPTGRCPQDAAPQDVTPQEAAPQDAGLRWLMDDSQSSSDTEVSSSTAVSDPKVASAFLWFSLSGLRDNITPQTMRP